MKKEFWLLTGSVVLTVAVALGVIRWLAPGLLGGPTDMQLVQLDEKVPAFYEGIFRIENLREEVPQFKDPITRIRNRPFMLFTGGMGPHDVLGFRNRQVPLVADVVTIGDSMTYGNNALMEHAWPGVMHDAIGPDTTEVYNISTGGWAATQYLYMFAKAIMFKPRTVVVAYYTGNDPLETFAMVYGNEQWQWLIPDDALTREDAPKVEYPVPEAQRWRVTFSDGVEAAFTPTLRLASNSDHPAVNAGFEIMAMTAEQIGELAARAGTSLVFTIIPTKELVYANKVAQAGLDVPADYDKLVRREQENIDALASRMRAVPGARYIDVVTPLQQAALEPVNLYTSTINGHPDAAGYRVIGETVAKGIGELLPARPAGLYLLTAGDLTHLVLVSPEGVWYFDSTELAEANGWPPGEVSTVSSRDLAGLTHRGIIDTVDTSRFGPACCNAH